MKNFLFVLVSVFPLFLISCSSTEEASQESEQAPVKVKDTTKIGIVHRVCQRNHQSWTNVSARLMDGTIIAGYTCDDSRMRQSQPADFFFVQSGDTIVYCGEKVLEVKFKD